MNQSIFVRPFNDTNLTTMTFCQRHYEWHCEILIKGRTATGTSSCYRDSKMTTDHKYTIYAMLPYAPEIDVQQSQKPS